MIKLGIIGAMDIEIAALKEKMENVTASCQAGSTYYEGTLEGLNAVVVQCGVGKVNAAMCAQVLCSVFGVSHIVNTGVAGSLCAELDIGDLVVSQDAMHHDMDVQPLGYRAGQVPGMDVRTFPADKMMIDYAFAAAETVNPGHTKKGRIATGDQFVAVKELKDRIIANTQGLCTEMEGAAIAQTAYRNSVPFVILRAISDKADNSAELDYPTFEAIAADRCARVVQTLAKQLKNA
jgi:adenosylhomocysteine nucleosidase